MGPVAGLLHALQLADAAVHLDQVDPRQAVPLRMPRTLPASCCSVDLARANYAIQPRICSS